MLRPPTRSLVLRINVRTYFCLESPTWVAVDILEKHVLSPFSFITAKSNGGHERKRKTEFQASSPSLPFLPLFLCENASSIVADWDDLAEINVFALPPSLPPSVGLDGERVSE